MEKDSESDSYCQLDKKQKAKNSDDAIKDMRTSIEIYENRTGRTHDEMEIEFFKLYLKKKSYVSKKS